MITIRKQIVTNEAMEPVGVIIDYQDWQKIEALLKTYAAQDNSQNLMAYAGAVHLEADPLQYQHQERDAWS
ncbi:MAG: hypothetical protein F6J95_032730 [Leptolyngbya sp. SIO1E4]|nr:hypothetical protein [Leptolyngbya sp. SIO1E4]